MSEYLVWNKITLSDLSEQAVSSRYDQGYVFVRTAKGDMNQTRSLRIKCSDYIPSSENRRVLRHVEAMTLTPVALPIPEDKYTWQIHKLGKDYYETKFGKGVFSASKIKELLTDSARSNFTTLLHYQQATDTVGYAICYENPELLHYAYPFYNLAHFANNYGIGMMLKTIQYACDSGRKYIYLGSYSRPADKYKLQFSGIQWFDGSVWQSDTSLLGSNL